MPSGARILIVENEANVARHLRDVLERGGFQVLEVAHSGEEAIASAERHHPDLVLMGIGLGGGVDGVEAAAAIRDRFDIPSIYVTAHADADVRTRADVARPLGCLLKPFSDDELQRVVVVALERHRSESRFSALLEAAPDGIAIADAAGRLVLVNRQLEHLFGYSRDELLGQSVDILVPDDLRARHLELRTSYAAAPTVRPMSPGRPLTGRHRDGREIPLEISLSPLDTPGGPLVIAVVRDVTERRQLEEQFRRAQRTEAVGRFAGAIAHDFNNLLTVIIGFTDRILTDPASADTAAARDAQQIRRAADKAASLTRQLLALGRKQVQRLRVLDLNDIVAGIEPMLRRLLRADIELTVMLAVQPVVVRVDGGQIEQVILNLAVNARDAMPNGGSMLIRTDVVTLADGDPHARECGRPGPYARLRVSDTGDGMDPDTQSQIFEPFFTTKDAGAGSGLGLASVYGIVRQSGGAVFVQSQVGEGAAFDVLLPQADVPPDAVPAPPVSPRLPFGRETILLVEDDDMVRSLTRRALERYGYTVLAAAGGEEALRIAGERLDDIELLVTDVIMPRMKGPALAGRIVAQKPGLPVLYVSGYAQGETLPVGEGQGGWFLEKPFESDTLARKVRWILDGAVERRKGRR